MFLLSIVPVLCVFISILLINCMELCSDHNVSRDFPTKRLITRCLLKSDMTSWNLLWGIKTLAYTYLIRFHYWKTDYWGWIVAQIVFKQVNDIYSLCSILTRAAASNRVLLYDESIGYTRVQIQYSFTLEFFLNIPSGII